MELIKDLGMIYPNNNSKRRYRFGLYECSHCGIHFKTQTAFVKSGKTKRCVKCKNIKHGGRHTRLYNIWCGMKRRCYNISDNQYQMYGGRGVTMCEDWIDSYESFRDWSINNGYSDFLQIDKDILSRKLLVEPPIYSPKTCMWVTPRENSTEANGIEVEVDGVVYKSKSEASRVTGIDRNKL